MKIINELIKSIIEDINKNSKSANYDKLLAKKVDLLYGYCDNVQKTSKQLIEKINNLDDCLSSYKEYHIENHSKSSIIVETILQCNISKDIYSIIFQINKACCKINEAKKNNNKDTYYNIMDFKMTKLNRKSFYHVRNKKLYDQLNDFIKLVNDKYIEISKKAYYFNNYINNYIRNERTIIEAMDEISDFDIIGYLKALDGCIIDILDDINSLLKQNSKYINSFKNDFTLNDDKEVVNIINAN
ncbi:hypothetical protein [Clostridium manihotivorum]|uniref:Uncharacterized protein n=1 Tax=Clostridium manihotivorum TaxID=2320868 RepID=A0A3R5QRD3_9CLOT|nr:hypothetical protein [Clostridium manihotivorum]QAA30948.1 hypothetical protein C1I91_04300 [Clostridium manihotivorum]